jgi:hypothetical protein
MSLEKFNKDFTSLFKQEPEDEKTEALISEFGEETLRSVINYLIISGAVKPVPEGKRNNPYAFLYKVCSKWENRA